MPAAEGEPGAALLQIDPEAAEGRLLRAEGQVVILPGLHPEAAESVAEAKVILIAEMDGAEPRHVYSARLQTIHLD